MTLLATALVVVLFALLVTALLVGGVAAVLTFLVTSVWTLLAGESVPLAYNLRNLLVRRNTTLAAGGGVAFVVLVLSAALMLAEGVRETMGASGRRDVAMVLRKGSDAEMASGLEIPQLSLVLAAPGVQKDAQGAALGVGEVVVVIAREKIGASGMSNLMVRGVPANGVAFRPEIRVVEGRPPRPGTDEAMIGARLRGRFAGVELGKSIELRKGRNASVVGVFEAAGSSYESEVWVDVDTLRAAFGREGTVSSVRVKLESPAAYDGFAAYVEQDKQLGFEAQREVDYYRKQSQATAELITVLGNIIAFLFSLAAMIGATITMYSSVSERQREIGTLRALGFSRRAILFGFQTESLVLALLGGAVGLLGSLGLGAVKISMINFQTWSELVFRFHATPRVLLLAVGGAALMGLLGGFLPAVRAARVSALTAMRE